MGSEETTLLVVDAGTSQVRAKLIDLSGQLHAESARSYRMMFPAAGQVEIDPDHIWRAMVESIREIGSSRSSIAAICVAAELGTVFLDAHGKAIGNALCWPDRRSRDQSAQLTQRLDPSDIYAVTGRVIDPGLPAAKLLWVLESEPDRMKLIRSMVSIKDFLVLKLCGQLVTDEAHASYSMLFDVSKRQWADNILAELGINKEILPTVRPATEKAGVVSRTTSELTGLQDGTPVIVGGPDGTVGTIGAGLVSPGVTVDLIGTADVIFHAAAEPHLDPGRRTIVNVHLVPGLWTIGGPTGTTGGMLSWLSEAVGYGAEADSLALLDTEANEIPPGAEGLVCLTSMSGERFPDWDPSVRGVLFGLSMGHGRAHIARAALEGAVYPLRSALDIYQQLGLQVDEVRVVGGGAKSPVWNQIRADICGIPVRPTVVREATSLGAAILAAVSIGAFPDIPTAAADFVRAEAAARPRVREEQLYQLLYKQYRRLREKLGPAFDAWSEALVDPELDE